jgi:hypothetical protein
MMIIWICNYHFQTTWAQVSKALNKPDSEANSKGSRRKKDNRRRPLHQIQPILANEVAKKAREKFGDQNEDNTSAAAAGGILDKIEDMLAQGKYRPDGPDGQPRTGYRIRRKGQPTIYVRFSLYKSLIKMTFLIEISGGEKRSSR